MTILEETERIHEILGPIRFEDGKYDPKVADEVAPFWLARPMGWLSDGIELLLSGNSSGPDHDSLERAAKAFKSLEKIEEEGRELIRPQLMNLPPDFDVTHYDANTLWIDCQQTRTIAVFHWEGFVYIRWDATLSETNSIIDIQRVFW